jgi:hypothetical protein
VKSDILLSEEAVGYCNSLSTFVLLVYVMKSKEKKKLKQL